MLGALLQPREQPGLAPEASAEMFSERLMQFYSAEERLGWGGAPRVVHDERDAIHWYKPVRRTLQRGHEPLRSACTRMTGTSESVVVVPIT